MAGSQFKFVKYSAAALGLILLAVFTGRFLFYSSYRSQIPVMPDLTGIQQSQKEQITEASEKAHRKPSSGNLGMLGMIYHSNSFYDEAASCYQLAYKKDNNQWEWLYYYGYLKLEMGDSESAKKGFSDVLAINPRVYMASYYLANAYQNLGLSDSAETIYRGIGGLRDKNLFINKTKRSLYYPLPVYAEYELSRLYLDAGHREEVEQGLKGIIRIYSWFGPAYRLLGEVYNRKGMADSAKIYTVRSNDFVRYFPPVDTLADRLSLVSRSESFLLKQIDAAINTYNLDWALEIVNNSIKDMPDNKYIITKAVKLYLVMGKPEEAQKYLNEHLNYFADDFVQLHEVAGLLFNAGLNSQALDYFRQMKKLKKDDAEGESELALWLWRAGERKESVALTDELLEKYPENLRVLSNAVYIFLSGNDRAKAERHFSRLELFFPYSADISRLKGMIAEMDGNISQAAQLYEKAFQHGLTELSLIHHLGDIYLRNKNWEKAKSLFLRSLDHYPNNPELLEKLGYVLVNSPIPYVKDIESGRLYSERAFFHVDTKPVNRVSAGTNLAAASFELGDSKKALQYLNMTLAFAKGHKIPSEDLNYLQNLQEKINNYNVAKRQD